MVAVTGLAGAFEDGKRLDQHVDRLDRPQLADADDVGGVGLDRDRLEFGLADAVAHDAHHGARRADLGAEQVGDVAAFEQEEIGAPVQDPLDGAIKAAADGAGTIDQRAAVGRIGADRMAEIRHQARQRRALGAVAVQDVGLKRRNPARDAVQRVNVARIELARNGGRARSRGQAGRKLGKNGFGARAARGAVDEQTDLMPAPGLALHQIDHMPEQAAERGAQDVQDFQARRARSALRMRRRGERHVGRRKRRSERAHLAHKGIP